MIRTGQSFDAGTIERPVFNRPESGVPVRIDPATFAGSDFVQDGVLVAGTPLKADGTLAIATETAIYVLPYGCPIADPGAALADSPEGDVAGRTRGDLVRDRIEGNIGRVLTAAEATAITASGNFALI